MTFPTIPTVAAGRVLSVLATSPSGTHTSPNLSSLTKNAGDLLIAIVIIYDGNSTNAEFSSWGGGFTEFKDQAGTATMGIGCAYKWSTGSETGTFTVTSADTSTNDSAFFLLSIAGAHSVTPPEAGDMVTGTSAAADPAAFDPAGWGAEDTLWIAVGGSGETATTGSYTGIASAPTNYSDYVDSGISADVVGGVEGAVSFRQLNAASENVGTYSVDTSNARNAALVIAVRPANPISVTPTTATLTLSTFAPTILLPKTVTPSTATLTLTGFAPTVSVGVSVTPSTAALVLSTFAPTVTVSSNVLVTPSTATLALTTFAPTVLTPRTVVPLTATLALTAFAPTVLISDHKIVTPPTLALIITTFAPIVTVGGAPPAEIRVSSGMLSAKHVRRLMKRK